MRFITLRDAVRFSAAAWPTRSREARIRFETMAIDRQRFADEAELARWRRILGRIFALVPEDLLELEETRTLRRELGAEGLLTENPQPKRVISFRGEHRDFVRDRLHSDGVDLESGLLPGILDASDALYAQVQATPSTATANELARLWAAAIELISLIDESPSLPDQADRSCWGHISNAVERVVASANYSPGENELPALPEVFSILRRLSASHYPIPRENIE